MWFIFFYSFKTAWVVFAQVSYRANVFLFFALSIVFTWLQLLLKNSLFCQNITEYLHFFFSLLHSSFCLFNWSAFFFIVKIWFMSNIHSKDTGAIVREYQFLWLYCYIFFLFTCILVEILKSICYFTITINTKVKTWQGQ